MNRPPPRRAPPSDSQNGECDYRAVSYRAQLNLAQRFAAEAADLAWGRGRKAAGQVVGLNFRPVGTCVEVRVALALHAVDGGVGHEQLHLEMLGLPVEFDYLREKGAGGRILLRLKDRGRTNLVVLRIFQNMPGDLQAVLTSRE